MNNATINNATFTGHFISAPWRSSGKSMLSMGLARAATRQSIDVQTFKKGPDYIDPLWLKAASHKPCFNLDPHVQGNEEVTHTFQRHMTQLMLVEGTMGLHDGLALDGHDSNAAVAKRLGLPVLLVVDCPGMHRSIAPLVNGIVDFDPEVNFSGLILNRVKSSRHASKIEKAIQHYCSVPVMGVIPDVPELRIDEQELGLVPAPDFHLSDNYIDSVADLLQESCDLSKLFVPNITSTKQVVFDQSKPVCTDASSISFNVGIAQDQAFHFYYADDLETLRRRGVNLVPFSPLRDAFPDNLDALLIGGGFPERHAAALADNKQCRDDMASAIANGLPVRAECGGLMYLCQSIEMENVVWPMVGAIDGAVRLHKKPQGRGYMKLESVRPEFDAALKGKSMPAHEFHHSSISFDTEPNFAYRVTRGHGIDGQHDGVCVQNVVASYAHFRHTESTPWIDWFLDSIKRSKQDSLKTINHV